MATRRTFLKMLGVVSLLPLVKRAPVEEGQTRTSALQVQTMTWRVVMHDVSCGVNSRDA